MRIPSRSEVIAAARTSGRRIAAVLPIHYPRALVRACGFQPIEVWGPPGQDPTIGNRHFQAYACAIVRNAASFLLSGRAEVDAVLVPHTCDSLQGMASVLKDFVRPSAPVLTFYLPRGRREADTAFLAAELERLREELARVSGHRPSDAELAEAIRVEDEAGRAFSELWRARDELALSDRAFFALLRAREYLPAEQFIDLARSAPRGGTPPQGVKLGLSGIVPEPMALFDAINQAGGRVVADDLAAVSRRAYPAVEDADPIRRLARTLLSAPPEPTLGSPIPERVEHVTRTLVATGARGLIVYDVKFCEPELFYLPLLEKGLAAAGLPVLHIEVDLGQALSGQVATRVEAFVEMLR